MKRNNAFGPALSSLSSLVPCTIVTDDGLPCAKPSAEQPPFPICDHHLVAAYRHVCRLIAVQHVAEPLKIGRSAKTSKGFGMNGWPSVVYYARIGEHIKIGHTRNLSERMAWYPPSAKLLALEPGDASTELARQHQFRHALDARDEWFRPEPDLMQFVQDLAAHGLPAPVRSA